MEQANNQADALKAGDTVRVERDSRHAGLCGRLLDVYDDRFGYPEVWRVHLLTGEIVMEQADRLIRST